MMTKEKLILKLLNPGSRKGRMVGSWAALCTGILLLLCAIMFWMDFSRLLKGKSASESTSSYIVIGKQVTNESMMNDAEANLFTEEDIRQLQQVKGVEEAGRLEANNFPVSANMGGSLGFYTELFLASVDNRYLDVLPDDWSWKEGQQYVPVIMSSEFLNMYNYGFALSQGLPQLSRSSVQSLPFEISIDRGREKFRARIVGFTDRIGSILVPQHFMDAMNTRYSAGKSTLPSRLIVKVKDPSGDAFVRYLRGKGYTANQEQLRWNRIRNTVQAIVSSVGGVALIVTGVAFLSFILFIEITVQRSAAHIRLLKQLGYAPKTLSKILFKFFIPWLASAVVIAALIVFILHITLLQWLNTLELQLRLYDAWILLPALACILIFLTLYLSQTINRILRIV